MAQTADARTPVERVIDALHHHGRKVRQSGPKQWEAQCPNGAGHRNDDRRPGLGVSESPTGAALLYCQAGCTTPDVVGALGLSMRDLFPEQAPKVSNIGKYGREKARYAYYDEDGELLYEVLRYVDGDGRKTFRARTPDGAWSVKGVRKVLYNLPQVAAAIRDGRPVIVCEGEKDAENAQWAFPGAATTCNPFGADPGNGSKFTDDMLASLRGADVTIVADDDNPGRLHADTVRARLGGIAKSVRIMLPAQGHKDLSEHLGAGLGIDELRPLTGHEPAAGGVEDDGDAYLMSQLVDWDEFWAEDHSAVNWIAEPIIPGGGRAIAMYAPAKSGKSLVALSMAAAVATGRPILGQRNTAGPRHVLYVDYEMTTADIQDRLTDMGYGPGVDLSHFHYAILPALPPLDTADGATALCRLAELVNAELVVIDTMGRAVSGDENDADTVRNFYRHTGLTLKQAGRTYLRTDHAGKDVAKGQRGSSAKNDDVDLVWQLLPMEGAVTLKRTHSRMNWVPDTVVLHRTDDPLSFTLRSGAYPEGTKALADVMDELGVPLDASYRQARTMGVKGRNELIRAALKWRIAEQTYTFGPVDNCAPGAPQSSGRTPDQEAGRTSGAHLDDAYSDQGKQAGAQCGAHPGAPGSPSGAQPVSLDTGAPQDRAHADPSVLDEKDLF